MPQRPGRLNPARLREGRGDARRQRGEAMEAGRSAAAARALIGADRRALGLWACAQTAPARPRPIGLILRRHGARRLVRGARGRARPARHLRAAEARLQAAAEALPDGLVVFDRHDRIAFYNSRFPEMMTEALRAGLAIGKRVRGLDRARAWRAGPVYHPEMGEDFLERRGDARSATAASTSTGIADGRWVRIRENRTPDGGRVLLVTDITEERRRGGELRLLALAVEQAGDPVEITGADHGFTYVNHAFETTTGYSPSEALGREPQDILSSGMQPPEFFAEMRRELEAGRRWQGTIINRHRDGHLIEQETTIAPLRDESGRDHALRGGQARRHRGAAAGAGAGGERGALPRGGRRADRVHRAGRAGRLLDLHERGGGALHRR